MGLSISHNSFQGSYNTFHHFREWLASQIGVDLNIMDGFTYGGPSIKWKEVNSPLVVLLSHEDNEGEIAWEDCQKMAEELFTIAYRNQESKWYDKTEQLAAGASNAYKAQENLIFN